MIRPNINFLPNCEEIYSQAYGAESDSPLVLMLQPLPWEMQRLSWTYDQICRRLADKGFFCLSFHYLGTGDSDGSSHDFSLEKARQNSLKVLSLYSHKKSILVGFSFGANLATELSSSENILASFSVDPILDGNRYLSTQKDKHLRLLKNETFAQPSSYQSHCQDQILGYPLSPLLEDEIRNIALNNHDRIQHFSTEDNTFQPSISYSKIIERSPIWTDWDRMNFQHFSHETVKALVNRISEIDL